MLATGYPRYPETQSNPQAVTVDLTQPVIDLTKQVYEILSSDEEDAGGTNSNSGTNLNPYSKILADIFSTAARDSLDPYRDINWADVDDGDEDGDSDGCGFGYLYRHDSWMQNQRYSWSMERDNARNLTPKQSEQELRDLLANIQAAEEDIAPQDRTGTPEGMASHVALLEHQKIGLTWLQKMEDGTNRGGILGDDMVKA